MTLVRSPSVISDFDEYQKDRKGYIPSMISGDEEEIVFAESVSGNETTTLGGNGSIAISIGSGQREVISSGKSTTTSPSAKVSLSGVSDIMSVNVDEVEFND